MLISCYDNHMAALKNAKGMEYIISELNSEHKHFLKEGIKELSSETVQHRFFVAKKDFTDKELKRLTEYDKDTHCAIGAMSTEEPPRGIGVARFNQDHVGSKSAEFAIIIADKFQGQGFGHILLSSLIEEAKKRGITELYGQMKSTNDKMIGLVKKYGKYHMHSEGNGIISLKIIIN